MQETQNEQESLGTYLKKMREDRGISIEQVAYATRISLKMLRALEEDDQTALPAATFVRGYLQAYAKYTKLDSQDLLQRYQTHLASTPDPKQGAIRSHYLYARERYQEKRRLVLVIVLFATMLSVAGTYFLLKAKREKNKQIAQQAEQILKTNPPSLEAFGINTSSATATETKAAEAKTETKIEAKPEAKPTETALATKVAEKIEKTETKKSETATKTNTLTATASATKTTSVTASATATKTATITATKEATATATATTTATSTSFDQSKSEKKAYNLLLKAETDVWLRFQTDGDAVKDLTLRAGKGLMLRGDKVIKIFSGNLKAFKATLNGAPLAVLSSDPKAKSAVIPESETGNYPLPLFPQFTAPATKTDSSKKEKTEAPKDNAERKTAE